MVSDQHIAAHNWQFMWSYHLRIVLAAADTGFVIFFGLYYIRGFDIYNVCSYIRVISLCANSGLLLKRKKIVLQLCISSKNQIIPFFYVLWKLLDNMRALALFSYADDYMILWNYDKMTYCIKSSFYFYIRKKYVNLYSMEIPAFYLPKKGEISTFILRMVFLSLMHY